MDNDKSIRLFVDISLLKDLSDEDQEKFFSSFDKYLTVIMIATSNEIEQSESVLYGKRRTDFEYLQDKNGYMLPGIYLLSERFDVMHSPGKEYSVYKFDNGAQVKAKEVYSSILADRAKCLSANERRKKRLLAKRERLIKVIDILKEIVKKIEEEIKELSQMVDSLQ